MKRDASLDQLALFEPSTDEALHLMQQHGRAFEHACDLADLMHACLLPGARDVAEKQARASYESWLVCALFLDFEREAV